MKKAIKAVINNPTYGKRKTFRLSHRVAEVVEVARIAQGCSESALVEAVLRHAFGLPFDRKHLNTGRYYDAKID